MAARAIVATRVSVADIDQWMSLTSSLPKEHAHVSATVRAAQLQDNTLRQILKSVNRLGRNTKRLSRAVEKLNRSTWWLIALTMLLAVLTVALVLSSILSR